MSIQTWEGLSLIHPEDLPYRQPALPDGQPALPDGQPALSYRQPALQDLPDVFTAFRKAVEKSLKVREPFADPGQPLGLAEGPLVQKAAPSASLPVDSALHIPARSPDRDLDWPIPEHPLWRCEAEPDPRTAFPFSGGEANALERLASYVRADGALRTYKETRNGMVGADYSSKLSAWLANGSLSPRQVYHAVKQHEATYGANDSTYWMVFELLWRDFFRFQAIKQGDQLFALGGPQHKNKVPDAGSLPEDPAGTYRKDRNKERIMHLSRKEIAAFERWAGGQTGQPFIDANMRELAATGWMSNRGRQNAASYLVHDLSVDWRLGAWWFEALLLDYDVASNWGNWQYAAGVGLDPRSLGNGQRRFNPEKQAAQYDPDGEFVRLWADKTG
ncbi:MAG: DASH family cryptochrome [Bacteroidetes bacterium]|nr:DASH family cryptochrome [Bacteroidota bacterium]